MSHLLTTILFYLSISILALAWSCEDENKMSAPVMVVPMAKDIQTSSCKPKTETVEIAKPESTQVVETAADPNVIAIPNDPIKADQSANFVKPKQGAVMLEQLFSPCNESHKGSRKDASGKVATTEESIEKKAVGPEELSSLIKTLQTLDKAVEVIKSLVTQGEKMQEVVDQIKKLIEEAQKTVVLATESVGTVQKRQTIGKSKTLVNNAQVKVSDVKIAIMRAEILVSDVEEGIMKVRILVDMIKATKERVKIVLGRVEKPEEVEKVACMLREAEGMVKLAETETAKMTKLEEEGKIEEAKAFLIKSKQTIESLEKELRNVKKLGNEDGQNIKGY